MPSPSALLAVKATTNCPATVGVPEMTPLVLFRESPCGNPEAAKEVGKFEAVMV